MAEPYYADEFVTIWHGEALDVLGRFDAATFDALLVDPPYSSGGMFRSDRMTDPAVKYRGWSHSPDETRKPIAQYGSFGGDCRDQLTWVKWCAAWGSETLRVSIPSAVAFHFTDYRQLPATCEGLQLAGWTWQGINVWNKGVGRPMKGRPRNHLEYVVWATNGAHKGPEDDYPSALIDCPTVGRNERQHVTQKPVALLSELLRIVESPTHVLDPFVGSGSTLVAAKSLGLKATGIEQDERYCEIAASRLTQGVLDFGGVA